MGNILTYIMLGLVIVLTVIVVIMLVSLSRLKENIKDNNDKTALAAEYMQESLQQDIRDVQENMRGFQDSMTQTVNQSYMNLQNSVHQTVTQSYSAINQAVSQNYTELNKAIDSRLSGSFDSINKYLNVMNQDLGEMKSVASGIEDVKKVLSNVKTRGILGEIQLGSILREIMSPQQYDTNVATIPGSSERVEFAVKLPADGDTIYLPIDSKFPADAYSHLLDAYNSADDSEVKATRTVLINQFKKEARDIASKYLKYPYTTEFAVMFLPFEGLYAEAVNLGMIENLQNDYNVVIAGPSTMAALLNSLQLGFKTLAIQENAEKVWQVLGNVKAEFDKFASVLSDTQEKMGRVSANLDKLVGARTRQIQRALSEVESLDSDASFDSALQTDYYRDE